MQPIVVVITMTATLFLLKGAQSFLVDTSEQRGRKMVCYFTNWAQYRSGIGAYKAKEIDPFLCTHIVVAFAAIDSHGELKPIEWNDEETFKTINGLKKTNPDLKTLIAVGGWKAGSEPFTRIVKTFAGRRRFINSALRFLRRYDFDGLDYDWEYPASRGSPPSDKSRFSALVRETYGAFKDASQPNRPLLLAVAVGVGRKVAQAGYNIPFISRYVDWISLMTYDLTAGFSHTRHHAPLNGSDTLNLQWVIDYWTSQGCPSQKLVLGIAAYGRSFTLADRNNHRIGDASIGAGEPGKYSRQPGFLAYYEVCSNNWNNAWDNDEKVPYKYLGNQWVGYDDPASAAMKVKLALDHGLSGAMLWSLDMDDFSGNVCNRGRYPLLNSIRHVLDVYSVSVTETVPDPTDPRIHPTTATTISTLGTDATTKTAAVPRATTTPTTTATPTTTTRPSTTTRPTARPTSWQTTTARQTPRRPPSTATPIERGRCEFTCPRSYGFFPDPCNCRKFFGCFRSVAIAFTCPTSTLWDATKTSCSQNTIVNCRHVLE